MANYQTCSTCSKYNKSYFSFGVVSHNRNNKCCPYQPWNINECPIISVTYPQTGDIKYDIRKYESENGLVPKNIAAANHKIWKQETQEAQEAQESRFVQSIETQIQTHTHTQTHTQTQVAADPGTLSMEICLKYMDDTNKSLKSTIAQQNMQLNVCKSEMKNKDEKIKTLTSVIARLNHWCDELNKTLDRYEETVAEQDFTIKELQAQLKPREDNKGKCIENIMEVIEAPENRKYIGDGAYRNLMNCLGEEYNN